MSWKPEVIADRSGNWTGNACRFATREEADAYVTDLMMRWTAVSGWRSVESDDPVNQLRLGRRQGEADRLTPRVTPKAPPDRRGFLLRGVASRQQSSRPAPKRTAPTEPGAAPPPQ
jgi:hypothetical protein